MRECLNSAFERKSRQDFLTALALGFYIGNYGRLGFGSLGRG